MSALPPGPSPAAIAVPGDHFDVMQEQSCSTARPVED